MRTNIEIDDELMEEAIKLSSTKIKKNIINEALQNYVNWLKRKEMTNLFGKITWEGNLMEMREASFEKYGF